MSVTIQTQYVRNLYHSAQNHSTQIKRNMVETGRLPTPVQAPMDRVTLSKRADQMIDQEQNRSDHLTDDRNLDTQEQQAVNELKRRDSEVKSHEAAHMAAGGGIVQGGATYQYQSGPDGKMYAVGGEVQIDVSAESDPAATIRKMQQVRAAALAPSQPSGTDRAVAAQATQVEAQARIEKSENDREDLKHQNPTAPRLDSTANNSLPADLVGTRIDFMA